MSFTRANPGGWSTNQVLTSAQMNALDIDHSNAIDKTTNNDTVAGVLTFQSGAGCVFSNGAGIVLNGTGSLLTGVLNAIQIGLAGAFVTTVAGGLCLGGGATDWPTFQGLGGSLPRTDTRWQPCDAMSGVICSAGAPLATAAASAKSSYGYGFQAGTGTPTMGLGGFLTNAVAGGSNPYCYLAPLRMLHNGAVNGTTTSGATLTSATLTLVGGGSGTLPTTMPAWEIFRTSSTYSATPVALISGGSPSGYVTDTATVGTFFGSHTITYTPTQNNLIDLGQYNYYAVILDQCGATSYSGTYYEGITLSFSTIANMGW